jgi:hypothetical protein
MDGYIPIIAFPFVVGFCVFFLPILAAAMTSYVTD